VHGRILTSWPSPQTDIRNAGATWVDEEVHVCMAGPNTLVTSRKPDDLKAFCLEAVTALAGAS
jgi:protease I